MVNPDHGSYGWRIPYAVSAVLLFTVPHTATNIQVNI